MKTETDQKGPLKNKHTLPVKPPAGVASATPAISIAIPLSLCYIKYTQKTKSVYEKGLRDKRTVPLSLFGEVNVFGIAFNN